MKNFFTKIALVIFFSFCSISSASCSDYSNFNVKLRSDILGFSAPNGAFLRTSFAQMEKLTDRVYRVDKNVDLGLLYAYYDVEYIEPDYEVFLHSSDNSEIQWNLSVLNIYRAWDLGLYGNEVRVGVIDSGLRVSHPDIDEKRIVARCHYINNNEQNVDVYDDIGHGTFVSGLIAGTRNNGIGIDGISDRVKLIPLKLFALGKTVTTGDLILPIKEAAVKYNCDVINMSWGTSEKSAVLEEAVDYALAANSLLVASVGNDGRTDKFNVLKYPAAFEQVIGVGSVNRDRIVSAFSQKNDSVYVTAPGESVTSLALDDETRIADGTSYSAPMITALCAIAKCVDKNITQEQVMELLRITAVDAGEEGYDTSYGHGIVDAAAFLDQLIRDKEIFVSPVEKIGDNISFKILNNSQDSINVLRSFATYKDEDSVKWITNAGQEGFNIGAGDIITDTFSLPANRFKYFLWNQNLAPFDQVIEVDLTDD